MKTAFLMASLLLLEGCAIPKIVTKAGVKLFPPANAEAASVVTDGITRETIKLPKNTTVVTETSPATAAVPALERTTITLAADGEKTTETKSISASLSAPRAPDRTVELRKVDNEARKPFLYASIIAAFLAIAALYLKYPSAAGLCGVASVAFFVGWQFAGLPIWFHIIGFVAIAIGIGLYFGHEKGEKFPIQTKP